MAIPTPASNLSGLALRLVREGFLPVADAERMQNEANTQKLPLISHLISSKKRNSGTIAKVASEEFGVPLFDVPQETCVVDGDCGLVGERLQE